LQNDEGLFGCIYAPSLLSPFHRRYRRFKPKLFSRLVMQVGAFKSGRRVRPASLFPPGPAPLPNLRQVHLISAELFACLSEAGFQVGARDLGEVIAIAGLDPERMPLGTLIELGPMAIIQLTGLPTACFLIGRFKAGLKRQVLLSAETSAPFKCGVLGLVRAGGAVAAGDRARVRLPASSSRAFGSVGRFRRRLPRSFASSR
jgi:hypothetical protein